MANPQLPQGTLNRVRGSINYANNQGLNVLAQNLGKEGIIFQPITESSALIGTLTGGVTSPEPYQMVEITIHLLKTQGLGAAYKNFIETLCDVGDFTIKSDSAAQPDYQMSNGTIVGGTNPANNGTNPEFVVRIHAIYLINASLYDLA